MQAYQEHIKKTVSLLEKLFSELELASKGKLSTDEITTERFLWEIFNKIFNTLVILENCLKFKDSLTAHLTARYVYEMLIIFAYIVDDRDASQEKARKFLSFNQFKNSERKWTDLDLARMIDELQDSSRFELHKKHYRHLCNFAHPSMDSFMLNRRGDSSEFHMILITVLLTVGTMIEIAKICLEEDLYFTETKRATTQLVQISSEADFLMKTLGVPEA